MFRCAIYHLKGELLVFLLKTSRVLAKQVALKICGFEQKYEELSLKKAYSTLKHVGVMW
jgi:hypothetical protein